MEPEYAALDGKALELLKMLGRAANTGGIEIRFEHLPLPGYPLGWLLHPGLRDSLAVVEEETLRILEQAGMVEFKRDATRSQQASVALTDIGWRCYARATGGPSPSSPSDDDSRLRD